MSTVPRELLETAAEQSSPVADANQPTSRHDAIRDLLWRAGRVLKPQQAFDVALGLASRWGMAGREDEVKRLVRDTYEKLGLPVERNVEPSDLRGVLDPAASEIRWLVEDLIPEGSNVLSAAEKKTGKTMAFYTGFLQAAHGDPVFGRFAVKPDLRVQLWQFEMPEAVSLRRLRKACIGLKIDPAWLAESDRLTLFSQPDLELCEPEDLAVFHRHVLDSGTNIVLLDSVGEAFSSMNPSDNRDVRRFLKPALNPLTKAGVSTVLLHHKRKGIPGGKADDESDSILGAQSFQAKASRIYSMMRVGTEDKPGDFVVRLRSLRGWDLTQTTELHLHVHDEQEDAGTGTVVEAMSPEDVQSAGVERVTDRALRLMVEEIGASAVPYDHGDLREMMMARHGITKSAFDRAYKAGRETKALRAVPDPSDKRRTRVVLGRGEAP